MARTGNFWNWIARRYARMPVRDEAAYRQKLEITQSYLRPDWQVLEFGCGTGSTALEHAAHVSHLRAIDSAEGMIAICREKAALAGVTNVRFERADFDAIQVPEGSLDAVLGMSVLHLMDDPDATISRVFDMLRPGGLFFSSTTCLDGLDATGFGARLIARVLLPAGGALGLLPRMTRLSRAGLRARMEAAGFEIERDWLPDEDPTKAVFIVARKPQLVTE
ncbi:class I SAM-dependent methyltransferase [Tropicimonas isoalkanivorans]|uniref:Methyltransferase domain-containing protein n=1 Tax=Tropicimonas isoalkanivorans TaxID=441112 RepID=A0A1I1PT28_9RHOB|nr:class I SAM-dependent methyltransferase [Tropicimonas isoalkanivorans]SFD12802.1 Methyltransferase domain-containing protein [Tropicimonas isoalkanivorans]